MCVCVCVCVCVWIALNIGSVSLKNPNTILIRNLIFLSPVTSKLLLVSRYCSVSVRYFMFSLFIQFIYLFPGSVPASEHSVLNKQVLWSFQTGELWESVWGIGLSKCLSGKEPISCAGDTGAMDSIPVSRGFPRGRHGNPL